MRRYPPVFHPYENGQFESSRGTSSSHAIEALFEFSIRESDYRNARDYWHACMGLVQAGRYRLYWPPDSPGHTRNEIVSVKISGRTPAGARTRVAIDTVMEKLRYYVLGEDALQTSRRNRAEEGRDQRRRQDRYRQGYSPSSGPYESPRGSYQGSPHAHPGPPGWQRGSHRSGGSGGSRGHSQW
ncbi:uncharacterized protein LDX57_009157 [Aspergillus melleus]|uniref:uncharacterized protein n=1 Tax=Aspergillus melleus TaxID=138277 RepID=UPI001E8CFEEC|nr:uncharacterized protein LDX57_009157 [Aspergillus melleus]KAH8431494.1 hypothetical protein LDX57_009157 [Aspergillus melleus]